jgi:hypothetical protein
MSLQPIPEAWLRPVCALLRKGGPTLVRLEPKGRERWESEFPDGERYELEQAFFKTLETVGVTGCPVQMDFPTGDTWEFYFMFRKQRLYGKVLLYPAKDKVMVFSAHRPIKPKLRCE